MLETVRRESWRHEEQLSLRLRLLSFDPASDLKPLASNGKPPEARPWSAPR